MQASSFERRFHVPLIVAIYALGLYSPWERYWGTGRMEPAWLSVASLLTRTGSTLGNAVFGITVASLLIAAVGLSLRLWSAAATYDLRQTASTEATDYGYPRYLGSWLFHFSLVILMPPTGALFALLAHGILAWRLMHAKESTISSSVIVTKSGPVWLKTLLSESYFVGYFVCFALFSWRYDAFLLTRCVILCFGAWLVLKAVSFPK